MRVIDVMPFLEMDEKNNTYITELKMFTNIDLVRVYHSTSCNKKLIYLLR